MGAGVRMYVLTFQGACKHMCVWELAFVYLSTCACLYGIEVGGEAAGSCRVAVFLAVFLPNTLEVFVTLGAYTQRT